MIDVYALDSWVISDASEIWNFRVDITPSLDVRTPGELKDVYDPDVMLRVGREDPNTTEEQAQAYAQWARDAVLAWRSDHWMFVVISVTPVLKLSGVEFTDDSATAKDYEYGWLPGGPADTAGTWTNSREYVRMWWVNGLMDESQLSATSSLNKMIKEMA